MQSISFKRRISRVFLYTIVILMGIFMVAPMLWILITSLQPYINLASLPPKVVLKDLNINVYKDLFNDPKFITSLWNTGIVTLVSTVLTIVFATFTAYAVTSYKFKGKNAILVAVLSLQMAPAIILLIPIFILLGQFSLIDTYFGLIITYTLFMTPLAIWMLKGFFHEIPAEMREAARIDGCTRMGTIIHIIFPLAFSGIFATTIFCFISAWNELLIPLTLSITKTTTLTIYASTFGGLYDTNFAGAAGVSVLSSLPTVILALIFRKYIIKGLLEGAVKG